MIGGIDTHDGLCRMMANEGGLRVISVDYRLAPEHKYPAAFIRHHAAQPVMRVDAADHEAAAVIVDQRRHGVGAGGDRRVDADRHAAGRCRHQLVLGLADGHIARADHLHQRDELLAPRDRPGLGQLGAAHGLHLVEKAFDDGIERHGRPRCGSGV